LPPKESVTSSGGEVMNRIARVLTCFSLFVAASCGGSDSTSPGTAGITGSYALQTVNGAPLPFTVLQIGSDRIEVLNETVTLSDNGTFTQQGSLRITENGAVSTDSYTEAGSYTRNGTALNLVFGSDGTTGTGTISENTITVGISGVSLVYRK
jgi:hypothetical protein